MAKHIDTYLVGQVMGNALIEYCNKKGIEISDMAEKIRETEGIVVLGMLDTLGWATKEDS